MRTFIELIILLFIALFIQTDRDGSAKAISADVVVYGGTSAGVIAAVQVARMGKSVALIEPGRHIGGMSVEGLGGSDIDNHREFQNSSAVGGLALEFYRRVSRHYGRLEKFDRTVAARAKDPSIWRFESSVAEAVFNELVREHGVRVFLNHRLSEIKGVEKDTKTNRVVAIRCENGAEFRSSMFIDATYEGDLLAFAGVGTAIGREANSKYGEIKNGIRAENTYRQFEVRVDPYRIPGDPRSGLIPTIQDEPLGTPGEGDQRIQAYCFRLCLTKIPANRIPFSKPDNFDPEQYEIYRRYAKAGGNLWKPSASLPNGKTDQGSWHDLSANLYGMNHAYPGGSYATRERIYRQHLTFTQGLCWFLANDPDLPEDVRREWAQWGLCKDEFQDNGGWPRRFYVRDARRMVSDYVITEHHTRKTNQLAVPDPVAVAFWPPDTHHVRRIVRDGAAYNEGFVFGGDDWAPFGVSYRALVPRASECSNLLAPTSLSSSHVGYGAIRLEWTYMALGQSAATAACLAIDDKVPVQQVKYAKLRARLLADKQVL
jgi:FAD-dependent oxidoreductase family protein